MHWNILHFYVHFQCRPAGDLSDIDNEDTDVPDFGTVPTSNYATKAILLQSTTLPQRMELLLNTEYQRTIMEAINSPYTVKPSKYTKTSDT